VEEILNMVKKAMKRLIVVKEEAYNRNKSSFKGKDISKMLTTGEVVMGSSVHVLKVEQGREAF
jgi:hypothetical protein